MMPSFVEMCNFFISYYNLMSPFGKRNFSAAQFKIKKENNIDSASSDVEFVNVAATLSQMNDERMSFNCKRAEIAYISVCVCLC